MRWIRLNADWEDSPWLDALEDGAATGCWPRILCHAKQNGRREGSVCRVRALDHRVAARRWRVSAAAVDRLVAAALEDGALQEDGDDWLVVNWEKYQPKDATAAKRVRRMREKRAATEGAPPSDVTGSYAVNTRNPVTRHGHGQGQTTEAPSLSTGVRARGRALPEAWTPSESHREIALGGGINLDAEAERFRDWARANGKTYRDWDAAFRNWLRKAIEFSNRNGHARPTSGSPAIQARATSGRPSLASGQGVHVVE